MAALAPAVVERLVAVAQAARQAPFGVKTALYEAAARELNMGVSTLIKRIKDVTITNARKRRSDAGSTALSRNEATLISAAMMESHRKNGKRLLSVKLAVNMLRANGLIRAEFISSDTGEITPLSIATIARALRGYGLHPDTLLRQAPAVSLASRHPNHVWQIDASICVLYYLKPSPDPRQNGLQVMNADEFYKNKPANLAKIEKERVWRYAATDHTSGHIYVEYVLGAESGENLCGIFINAIQKRPDEPVHGVPVMAMLDPGSANTGALFKNLCKALQVRVLINEVGNPRAKGQVEKANDQIEKSFESGLKFVAVHSLEELNAAAAKWRRWFNGTSIHTRHGRTRYEAWLRITADQLRLAPEAAICRELATTAPVERTVDDKLQVSFLGTSFDVSVVPDIQNGSKVQVCRNPWRQDAAQVVTLDADGREVFYVVEPVLKDEHGFDQGAAVIGERYTRHADTPAQRAAKDIEKLLMNEPTLEGAAAARKGKRLAFGGKVDPWKHMDNGIANLPAYLPKRGTALDTPLPGIVASPSMLNVPGAMAVEAQPLNHTQMAMLLSRESWWNADLWPQVVRLYPDGVLEADLPIVAQRLQAAPRLMAVG